MGFKEVFELGKKYLWPSWAPEGASLKPSRPSKNSRPFMVYPATGILEEGEKFRQERGRREAGAPGTRGTSLLFPGRRETDFHEFGGESTCPKASAVQRLLDSFPIRKNAELTEYVRHPEFPEPEDQAADQMGEVFALTKKILSKALGPLNFRLIRDDDLLERALEKVHPQLPVFFRLILGKKRYIQFMLDHRERLVP
jgi:hypothetical protein